MVFELKRFGRNSTACGQKREKYKDAEHESKQSGGSFVLRSFTATFFMGKMLAAKRYSVVVDWACSPRALGDGFSDWRLKLTSSRLTIEIEIGAQQLL